MKNRPAVIASIVGIVMAALIAVFVIASVRDDEATDTNSIVGREMPELQATDLQGRPFRSDDYLGQFLLVNFFATWCPPCVAEHPELKLFSERHGQSGDAAVVSIAYDEPAPTVQQFFNDHGGEFPVLVGLGVDINVQFGVIGLPESYLVAPDGIVIKKFIGGITAAQVEAEMQRWNDEGGR